MNVFPLKLRSVFIAAIALILVSACAPQPRNGVSTDAIQQALNAPEVSADERLAPPPPQEVRSALIPAGSSLEIPLVKTEEPRFDIAASKVSAREFFMGLVEGSSVNMVVHPQVKGDISIDLKNTTIGEVLQVIQNVYGFTYFKTGNVYQIMPAGLQARTFQVNYLNLVRKGVSQTRVSSGQVTQVDGDEDSNDDDNNSAQTGVVSGSRIDSESTADFWSELRGAIQALIGTDGGRKVIVQPQASVVVAVAMPDELRLVEDYLKTIQNNLQRQVVIEAKVIEVSLADGFQTGINWAAMGKTASGKGVLVGQSGGGTIFGSGATASSITSSDLNSVGDLSNVVDATSFGGVFGMALNFNDFQPLSKCLKARGMFRFFQVREFQQSIIKRL